MVQANASKQLSQPIKNPGLPGFFIFYGKLDYRTGEKGARVQARPRYSSLVPEKMVGREGFEPSTNWLKANCSTS